MLQLLNTLYIMTDGAYLNLDHDTVRVEIERQTRLRAPLLHIGALVCMGDVRLSSFLIHRCAEDGRSIALFSRAGRFKARVEGPTSGNVLLRRAQHLALSDAARCVRVARCIVAGKIQSSRGVLLRAAREARDAGDAEALRVGAEELAFWLPELKAENDLDRVRGIEGDAARVYFELFGRMVADRETFGFRHRSRRPPLDRMNALLSFLYAMVRNDCASALEGVGLDPQVGFLHTLRPGRPALALDLMEEFRSWLADRLALRLANRRQLTAEHFEIVPGGAVLLSESGRKAVVTAYQERKQEQVSHRLLERTVPVGLVPHIQARLLARHLREDMADYVPHVPR
ncbi:MAG: type I-C CRISPR-associated endonuclease Cas1 [Actinobacteria bacterium]|nr:type I-C CRISPR-associated endonuclease Cas1 [Actinomycetota bacterium]